MKGSERIFWKLNELNLESFFLEKGVFQTLCLNFLFSVDNEVDKVT